MGLGWLTKGFFIGSRGVNVRRMTPGQVALRGLGILAFLVVAIMALAMVFKNRLIFAPTRGIERGIGIIGWEFEDLMLQGLDGNLFNAWFLPGPPGSAVVLLLHGNAGNLETMTGRIILYHKMGYGVMAIDYEGFGLSQGSPGEEATYADAEAAWRYLEDHGIPPGNIIIHGFSLGGAVAVELARAKKGYRNPLILDGTFTSLADVAESHMPILGVAARAVVGKTYDSVGRLGDISPSRLLVLHSQDDDVVPYALGRELYEAYLGGPKEFIELAGGHMDFYPNQNLYAQAIMGNFPADGDSGGWAGFRAPEEPGAKATVAN
ncbi:MAG: alpha/beta hydrolase [Deltaproteobacteria bacterium]|jgi:fermentation-respiration switch protein FrsA (DUF1100 family)|nr:alpha/beta hydrolase [Deltaproteobacteria bacterium]